MDLSRMIVTTYSELLGNDNKSFEDFISKVPSEKRIDIYTFLLGIKLHKSPLIMIPNLLSFWFDHQNSEEVDFGKFLLVKAYQLDNRDNRSILNYYSSLRFAELCQKEIPFKESSENVNINILKAYLKLNEEFIDRYDEIALTSTESVSEKYAPYHRTAGIFFTRLASDDYSNADINMVTLSQWIKSIYLFEYLASKDEFKRLLVALYAKYSINNWREYLLKMMSIVRFVISNQANDQSQLVNFEGDTELKIFDDWCFTPKSTQAHLDFIGIRDKPIIKVGEKSYKFIFDLFVSEKLFNGQYWLLKRINDSLPKNEQLDIRNVFTYQFSEKILLYKTLDYIFDNTKVKITGDKMGLKFDGSVDYYVRDKKVIFLFESKDIFLSAKAKASGDFQVLQPEIKKKLLYDSDENSRKAIKQLIFNIEKIIQDEFPLEKGFNPKRYLFVPYIVVHNRIFNTPGLNVILQYWMREELERSDILKRFRYRILGINLIDIDTLIFNQDMLKKGKLSLFESAWENYKTFQFYSSKKGNIKVGSFSTDKNDKQLNNSLLSIADRMSGKINIRWKRSPQLFLEKSLPLFEM